MLLFSVLKFLNAQKFRLMPLRASQLKFFAPQTYVCPKFRFCFGDAKRNKVTKKEKRRLRSALTVNLCNISFKKETGCAFNKVRWAQTAPLKPLTKSGALAPEPPCIHSLIHVLTKIFSETMSSVGWVFFLNKV